ncbi:MAG: LamG domain-containing protein, partial [Sphaerospermopsis sp. SIO1G2]|nr:LamG domain-containing protein [Sphaerospermopsis sp. SIO1G2]
RPFVRQTVGQMADIRIFNKALTDAEVSIIEEDMNTANGNPVTLP